MNEDNDVHTEFFYSYARALIDRDAAAIADHYAVPALIEFPGQRISVTDAGQTESFFAGVFGQYEAVTEVDAAVSVIASTGHSIWADVTWRYHGGAPDERIMYQLRSEEHTSELQSRFDLVCRLMLEKKNFDKVKYIL